MDYKQKIKQLYRFLRTKKNDCKLLHEVGDIVAMPTYSPEKSLKDGRTMKKENIQWVKKFHELNHFYKLYGLDVVGSNLDEYIDYKSFMETRNVANKIGELGSQALLLRDKYLFFKFMKSCGCPVPEVFAVMKDGNLYDEKLNPVDWFFLENEKDYFIKDIDGECASFVKHVTDYAAMQKIREQKKTGRFILQRKITQCEEMNRINPGAINTLRIATINKDGKVYVLTSLLRVGTSKTGNVDNWAAGGIAVGIRPNGYLKEFGFFKPGFGTKISVHPDSKMPLNEFKIPQYEKALQAACEAHKFFYNVRAIGWDVAIADNGPFFIEGNDNWEISLQQVCDRPLRKEWMEAVSDCV